MQFTMRAMLFLLAVAVVSLTVAQFPSAEESRPVAKTTTTPLWEKPHQQTEKISLYEIRYRGAGEDCIVSRAYQDMLPHGDWIWKNAAGKVLQTARFEKSELTKWNGKPVHTELKEWYARNPLSEKCREALREPAGEVKWWYDDWLEQFSALEVSFHGRKQVLEMIGGYHDWDRVRVYEARSERKPAEEVAAILLHCALLENRTLGVRFGLPCLVSISTAELDWRDSTGVSAVKFATNSAAAEWVNTIQDEVPGETLDIKYLRSLFAGTSIQIDASQVPTSLLPEVATPRSMPRSFDQLPSLRSFRNPHRRCDLLGLVLLTQHWSCEQRGNALILLPHSVEQAKVGQVGTPP
jgi:hypothetical protein